MAFFVSGCDPTRSPGTSYTREVTISGVNGQCARLVDSGSILSLNGSGVGKRLNLERKEGAGVFIEEPLPYDDIKIGWNPKNFIAQDTPQLCWAATLAMAFKHSKADHKQEQFLQVIRDICGSTGTEGATLNQIVYALHYVHWKKTIWIADLGNVPSVGFSHVRFPGTLPLMSWTLRNQSDGAGLGIYPFTDTGSLVDTVRAKLPVIVGFNSDGIQHVVLIVEVRARVGDKGTYAFGDSPRIDYVLYIDPLGDGTPTQMRYEDLQSKSFFAFALKV